MQIGPGERVQLEYCVPESQRLADLWSMSEDIEHAIRYCDLHIEIDPTEAGIPVEEVSRREHTRQALCKASLVSYARAFTSGVRPSLDQAFVARLSGPSQQLHATVKALRDKWVAHPVNHFEDIRVRIDAETSDDGSVVVRGVSITAHTVGGFLMAWMMGFRALCQEAHALLKADVREESDRLSALARGLPPDVILRMQRVDGVPLNAGRGPLHPTRARSRFAPPKARSSGSA